MSEKDNEECYCDIMFANAGRTSKSKLPGLIRELLPYRADDQMRFVLDVGCADGRFTRCLKDSLPDDVGVIGLEPNRQRFRKAQKLMDGDGRLSFINNQFDNSYADGRGDFDCVLFSSSMHEISSASNDKIDRYTTIPIRVALKKAAGLLRKDGVVVVRDFVKVCDWEYGTVEAMFTTEEIENQFLRYVRECPFIDYGGSFVFSMSKVYQKQAIFKIRADLFLEFLLCRTWGENAWKREVKERKLILSKEMWKTAFEEAGLTDVTVETHTEEYPQFFKNAAFVVSPAGWSWPDLSITITGRKK